MTDQEELPVRAGEFHTVEQAANAVLHLLEAGFTVEEITVICPEDEKQRFFTKFSHQEPAGTHTPVAAATGGVLGAAAGGVSAMTVALVSADPSLALAGSTMAITGGVVGSLLGAMVNRGREPELANFYDQSVLAGDIVVAVEVTTDDAAERLAVAESIFQETGAQPLPLVHG